MSVETLPVLNEPVDPTFDGYDTLSFDDGSSYEVFWKAGNWFEIGCYTVCIKMVIFTVVNSKMEIFMVLEFTHILLAIYTQKNLKMIYAMD
jgi:hypothetical protein